MTLQYSILDLQVDGREQLSGDSRCKAIKSDFGNSRNLDPLSIKSVKSTIDLFY